MKIPAHPSPPSLNTPPENAHLFTLQEAHTLATDPDFKVSAAHAPKLGINALNLAQARLAAPVLTNAAIVELITIARTQLLWILGSANSHFARLSRELSDENLARLNEDDAAIEEARFRELITVLVSGTAEAMPADFKGAFVEEAAHVASTSNNVRDGVHEVLSLVFQKLIPVWEQRATKEIQTCHSQYAQAASAMEIQYYSQVSPSRFLQGQTARWITLAIDNPKAHGLKHSAFSDSRAVHRLQSALLCEVVAYPKTIAREMLPETLELDVDHLLRLQKKFQNVVEAQSVADLYACVTNKPCNKPDVFKQALWALENGDESYALGLDEALAHKLKTMVLGSAVQKLHRERLQQMLLESLDLKSIKDTTVQKWHYEGALEPMSEIREHLRRILMVHFPVFVGTYYSLLESQLEGRVWRSILSLRDQSFREWLSSDEQSKAEQVQTHFTSLVEDLKKCVIRELPNLEQIVQQCLFGNLNWNSISSQLTAEQKVDLNEVYRKIRELVVEVGELRLEIQRRRLQDCKTDMARRPPATLKTGFRLG